MIISSKIKANKWKTALVLVIAFVCISLAFTYLVIKDFSTPLIGPYGDKGVINRDIVDVFEYPGYFLLKNLTFSPFPKLDLLNNQGFYPYGTNNVFQPWGFERDIFYAIGYSFSQHGPWLQIYYLLSVLITAIGTLALLIPDYGLVRASGAGFLVSFCNFYAINKYPHHIPYSVVHWTTLSLIADFLIVKKVALKQHVSLILILVRACLLILSLGQELGYVAGFSLMSFTVSLIFIAVLQGYRYFRRELRFSTLLARNVEIYKREFLTHPRTCFILLSLCLSVAYLYLPLVLQISSAAKSFDFTGIAPTTWWTTPLRLFIPFFPILNPKLPFEKLLGDSPEGLGAGSPGWFFLILGGLGLWQTGKRVIIFIPLLLIFLLCLFYHPSYFPTLKLFPWFAFNRVGGRNTIIYPVILCLFALEINLNRLNLRTKRWLSALLVIVACIEIFTAYSFKLDYHPHSLERNFFQYMNYVKAQPGEAVLDWPFCVKGGNGVSDNLCPYYVLNSGVFGLRRFHEKKVMGQYFGRLHPSQVEPYLQAGWDKLLLPKSSEASRNRLQVHCFAPAEWSFFTDFYQLNDFAGINLYVDLLPEECVSEFYDRFGQPVAETSVPGPGRVQFIPKSPELRNQVNLALGVRLKFEPSGN